MQNSQSSETAAFSLEQAIQALESQRSVLGDDVVNAALGPLRARLASLHPGSAAPAPAVDGPGTRQRRILTILCADLSGFSAMSEMMDAEDVRDTMNDLWLRLDNAITAHGGHIDKHLGDGVIALWGADESREDDVERAIRAALAMQTEVNSFHPATQGMLTLKMRIGINTGPALYGQIGSRGELTATGEAVDLASRLEGSSLPGRIQISHDSYRHVRGVFDVEAFRELEIRAKAEPMRTYLVKTAKPRAFRITTRGIEGLETRMIGRQSELQRLKETFECSFHHKKLQVVSILGEAGIGKSRLIYELNTWAELQAIPWWWFKGRGSLSAMNSPYALLRDIFAFRFEISENDPLAVAHAKLEAGFRQIMADDEQALEKAQAVGHLIGLNFSESPHLRGLLQDPHQFRRQALFYLTQFFQSASKESPVMVMLDDLQWADTGSLDALIFLVNNLGADTPFMLVAGARPVFVDRYPRWMQELQAHATIQLSALSREDSRRLVEEILRKVQELPGAIRELVVGGAEGNPFYAEELIKMLIDARVIEPGVETWKVDTSRLATVDIPTTLTEVLQARLDSLAPLERFTLQHASVIGRVFWDDAVLALSGRASPEEIHQALAALCRKELIYEKKPSSFTGIHEYTFKHSMLYEVTYDTLLKRQRSQYHIQVAEWLEHTSGERRDEYLAQMAGHYEQAGETLRAVDLLQQAGLHAISLSALEEAKTFLARAIQLLEAIPAYDRQKLTELHLQLSEACSQQGDYPAAQASAEAAWSIAQEIQSDALSAAAQVQIGFIIMTLGNYSDARSYYIGALYLLESLTGDYRSTQARMLNGLATVEWRLGNLSEAESYARESYQIASETHDLRAELLALNRLGSVVGDLGRVDEEEQCYRKILEIARTAGMRERVAAALNNLGAVSGERKNWQGAWDYYMQALSISRETGVRHSLALNYINLGYAGSYLQRNFDDIRNYLREGIRISRQLGTAPITVSAVSYYGLMLLAQGDTARALSLFGACRKNPAFNSENEREIGAFLADWEVTPGLSQAGMARGESLDWETLLDQLAA